MHCLRGLGFSIALTTTLTEYDSTYLLQFVYIAIEKRKNTIIL
jgi:hypothetical protein